MRHIEYLIDHDRIMRDLIKARNQLALFVHRYRIPTERNEIHLDQIKHFAKANRSGADSAKP